MTIETHNSQILGYLKAGHSLTQMEALRHFGCFRLSGRIYDLKQAGHAIEADWLEIPQPDGRAKRVKRYRLA